MIIIISFFFCFGRFSVVVKFLSLILHRAVFWLIYSFFFEVAASSSSAWSFFSTYSRAINFKISSMRMTGNDSFITIFHSAIESEQMLKIIGIGSTCMIIRWRPNDRMMAPTSHMFFHGGITKSDWFSETELSAFNISMTTRTDSAIVIGCGSWKMEQSIPAKASGCVVHCIWFVNCHHDISGPLSAYKNHHEAEATVAQPT